jgi:dihydroneopterin aldolase
MPRKDQIILKGIQVWNRAAPASAPRQIDLRLWLDLGEAARRNRIDRTVDYREVHRRVLAAAARSGRDLAPALAREVLKAFRSVVSVEVEASGEPRLRLRRGENREGRR